MPDFYTCNNGHNYDAEKYPACPYCPANPGNIDYKKTLHDFKTTKAFEETQQFSKTTITEVMPDFKDDSAIKKEEPVHSFKQTQIDSNDSSGRAAFSQRSEKNSLVGWLVTVNNDQYGEDYKIYSGKNKIGTSPVCDIIVSDPAVSAEHLTIFFQEDEFFFQDNFSTNGTKLNGMAIKEGKLKEGDRIKIGNTTFKFKTVF